MFFQALKSARARALFKVSQAISEDVLNGGQYLILCKPQ